MVFQILMSGAGIAGPSLAYFLSLARAGHQVTIIERFPAIRKTGAQVDLRAQGIEVVKRSGLLDAICSKLVSEEVVSFVNSKGVVQRSILANESGQGAQSLTSEYEIMREELVGMLYDATRRLNGVKYIFGKEIESFTEEDDAIEGKGKVAVVFSDGSMETFDLLVDAGGQGSRIRRSILPANATEPYQRVGLHVTYFFVPRIASDDNLRRVYNCSGGRTTSTWPKYTIRSREYTSSLLVRLYTQSLLQTVLRVLSISCM